MTILGIDPGSSRIGYGLIEKNKELRLLECGVIGGNLLENARQLNELIKKYRPEVAAVEKLYFSKNVKTGIAVAQTRGALILELEKNGLLIKEFSPSEIKLAVAGYGLADKKAVSKMVKIVLKIPAEDLKTYDDATDALATAIAAANDTLDRF